MQSFPQIDSAPTVGELKPERLTSDVVYQYMTLVAMLLLLASLWVF